MNRAKLSHPSPNLRFRIAFRQSQDGTNDVIGFRPSRPLLQAATKLIKPLAYSAQSCAFATLDCFSP